MQRRKVFYLTAGEIIEANVLILSLLKIKKADKSEVLSYQKIKDIESGCKAVKGDIYDKAVYLLRSIIQSHAFASGNRRTAFIVTKQFLLLNKTDFNIPDNPDYARVMTGIRENYYTDEEIKNWISNGQIREFKRV